MTVEEIEILVTARVEEALKDIPKLVPTIKEAVKQSQEAFKNMNTDTFRQKLHQAVQFAKKKIADLKKSTENNEIVIKVNNKEVKQSVTQLEKEIDSLQKKISARQMKLDIINPQIDKIVDNTRNEVVPEGISKSDKSMDKVINNALSSNKDFTVLNNQAQKLYSEIEIYNQELNEAKSKMSALKEEANQTATSQNRLTSFFSGFKGKLEQAKTSVSSLKGHFNQMPKITQNITNNIKKMGINIKSGLGHILKYATALFSIRGIYSILSQSAQSWLSSQNASAKQLSANIEYMKYAMGSVFAPVIEYVINLVYQLMKAIQSVVYAFSGINIFAKAIASSMNKTAKSAKNTNKSLTGVHDEINNVSEKDSGSPSPSIDLSELDSQLSPLAQKLYDFFKPLKESWDNYGQGLVEQVKTTASQIGGLIASVWGSFENIISNGTVYSILENILAIIGNIAEAFSNAWNYNGNGDAIVQNLANTFNDLLTIINNIVKSTLFQWLLDIGVSAIKTVTDTINTLSNAVLWVSEKIGEFIGFFTGENSEKLDAWSIILGSIATAIGLVIAAVTTWNVISTIATAATTAFGIAVNILTSPITLVILAIAALIAIIVAIVVYWDEISAALAAGWEWIKQKAEEIWNAIADFFKNLWQGICDTATNIWNGIKDFFSNIWNGIKNTASTVFNAIASFFSNIWNGIKTVVSNVWNGLKTTISNVINGIKNTISNVLNTIKTVWNNIWNGIKTTVTNIWNGIWNAIKSVINKILSGIEKFVNGIVKGINIVLSGISKVANAVGSLIGLKPINLQLSTISLPRLKKGNVAYSETLAVFGEYTGASQNPEITAPQSIMYDTMRKAIEDTEFYSNNEQPINITVMVGNKKLGEIMIEDLRDRSRRTGKNIEALIGG